MTVTNADPVCITAKPNSEEKRGLPFKDIMRRHPTLKELQETKYPFPYSDLPRILMIFLKKDSFNFQSQKGPKRWEALLTPSTAVTIGW